MTEEQIRQNAANYASNDASVYWQYNYNAYIAGAKSRAPQEMFDEMSAKQKAEFMQENLGWARTCDLKNELKIRNEL